MRNVRSGICGVAVVTMMALGSAAAAWAGQTPAAATAKKPNPAVHAVTGTVEKVDSAAKTVSIKTADGTVKVIKVSEKQTVDGMKAERTTRRLGPKKARTSSSNTRVKALTQPPPASSMSARTR